MTAEKILESIENDVEYFTVKEDSKICGCVAIQSGKENTSASVS